MRPYFESFEIFSRDEIQEIENLCVSYISQFFEYTTNRGNKDGNRICIPEQKPFLKYLNKFSFDCHAMFMHHKPDVQVIRHVDDPNKRNCVLITPLYNNSKISPCYFYENDHVETPTATCHYEYGKSTLINTQQYHDLKNNENERYSFHVCFENDFDEVVKTL